MSQIEARWKIEQVAEYLDITVNTVYAWRSRNYGPLGRRCGKHLRYDPDEVKEWYYQQPTGAVA